MYRRQSDSSRTEARWAVRRPRAGIASRAFIAVVLALTAAQVLAAGTWATTVTLSSSPNPSQSGQPVHFGVIVSESGHGTYETGTVTITDVSDSPDVSSVVLCGPLPLNGSSGVKTTSCDAPLGTGVHDIAASYSGDANYAAQTSTTVSQVVSGILLQTYTPTSEYSAGVSFSASVTGNNPTGTVTFSDVDSLHTLCTATLNGNGSTHATGCTNYSLTPGTYHIGAAYQGDGNNPSMVSNNVTVTVAKAVSHTSLTAPASADIAAGTIVHFTAKLTVDTGVRIAPTGTVNFIDGGADGSSAPILCHATATQDSPGATTSTASCDAPISTIGNHLIGAYFNTPDSPYMTISGSNEHVVLVVRYHTSTTLTISPAVSSIPYGQSFLLTATVSNAVNPTGLVEFDSNVLALTPMPECPTSRIRSDNTGICGPRLSVGSYMLAASYLGDDQNTSSTGTLNLQVTKGNSRFVIFSPSPSTVTLGSPVAFAVDVEPMSTGTITVSDGTSSCSYTQSGAGTGCAFTPTSTGVKTVTATYAGDNNLNSSSATTTITVNAAGSTTYTVTPNAGPNGSISPSTPQTVNAGATATFSVTPASGYTANVSGCGGTLSGGTYTTAPVNANCSVTATFSNTSTANVNLNQFGLSGLWYNPATSGQGIVLSMFPDYSSPGHGIVAGGWFTYDVAPSGGPEKQRWYSLQGSVDNIDRVAALNLYYGNGGNFDAPPTVPATQIGNATLQFSDCAHGTLTYTFADGSGRSGTIPLTRLDANVTCSVAGDNGSSAPAYRLSGAWYKPSTSGQGFFAVVNPADQMLFAAWYTYMPNGVAGGSAAQRWYTLQLGPGGYTPSTSPVSNIPIYTGTGGVFDNPAPYLRTQVGTATLTFVDCGHARIDYSFAEGTNAGLSGSIDLVRLGSTPAQCGLSP